MSFRSFACLAIATLYMLVPANRVAAQVTEADSMALITLYNRMGGPDWTIKTGWLQDRVGNWFGISVDANRVARIDLPNNNLTGSIPAAIGQLTHVDTLAFSANELTGSIPPELGNVDSLKFLLLPNNELTGSIPPELAQLADLEFMALAGNRLTGELPAELGQLDNLTFLDLFRNLLEGPIPPELGEMERLETLFLTSNRFTGTIPVELAALDSLQIMHFASNQLEGSIPPELGVMPALRLFDVSFNNLVGEIPASLGDLGNLEVLWLFNNQLVGPLPEALGNLANLKTFNISNNNFTGNIPESFAGMVSLTNFNFRNTEVCEPAGTPLQTWLDGIGTLTGNGMVCESTSTTLENELPETVRLAPHYPNPARNLAFVRYGLPRASSVTLSLFDIQGRLVQRQELGTRSPGWHEAILELNALAQGTYWYQLQTAQTTLTRGIVVQ